MGHALPAIPLDTPLIIIIVQVKTLTEGEAHSSGDPVARELGDSEENIAQEEAGHMSCLALPVQHVVRTRAQTAGSKGGGQEERRNEQPYGVQSEPQVPIPFIPLYLRWKFLRTREYPRLIRGVFQRVFDAELSWQQRNL